MRTLKQLAQQALDIQDACNLSGVVHEWSRVVSELRELWNKGELPCTSTDEFNRHPVNRLFADKLMSLSQAPNTDEMASFSMSYDACYRIVKEGR